MQMADTATANIARRLRDEPALAFRYKDPDSLATIGRNAAVAYIGGVATAALRPMVARDRKSTRLNSSHLGISYAVFCLKKTKHDAVHAGSNLFYITGFAAVQGQTRVGIDVLKLLLGVFDRPEYLVSIVDPPGLYDLNIM